MVVEYGFVDVCWVWFMGFVGFDSIMLIWYVLHVYTPWSCIMLWFVLCCAYYVDDKMSFRCFCVDNHVSLSLKHQMIMCFHTLPLACFHALVAHFCIWCRHTIFDMLSE